MASFAKLTAVFLFVAFVVLLVEASPRRTSEQSENQPEPRNGHHFVKRQADYDDGDDNGFQPAASNEEENAFDRPHRIRVLPAFLH